MGWYVMSYMIPFVTSCTVWCHMWHHSCRTNSLCYFTPCWPQTIWRYYDVIYGQFYHECDIKHDVTIFGRNPYVILPLVDKNGMWCHIHILGMTYDAMTKSISCYDEMRMIWRNAYDMTKCVFYHMYMISIQNRAGGHGPAVPLPPVEAADAANSWGWVRSARAMWLGLKQTSNKTKYGARGGGWCGE